MIRQPDPDLLAKQLDEYIEWIYICLEEDCTEEARLEMLSQLYSAKSVRADIKRIYEV